MQTSEDFEITVERVASALARHAGDTCFRPDLPDDPDRIAPRNRFRDQARAVLRTLHHAELVATLNLRTGQLAAARGHAGRAEARITAAKQLAAEYLAHTEPGERAEVPVDELLAALKGPS